MSELQKRLRDALALYTTGDDDYDDHMTLLREAADALDALVEAAGAQAQELGICRAEIAMIRGELALAYRERDRWKANATQPDRVRALTEERDAQAREIARLEMVAAEHSLCGAVAHECRRLCNEIMGGNLAFIDDDFARCLLTLRAERDALRAELTMLRDQHSAECAEADALRARAEAAERDADRYRAALEELHPGIALDVRYADDDDDIDALRARLDTIERALVPTDPARGGA